MTYSIDSKLGKISLTDSLIANLAGIATTECYGVAGMASRNIHDGLTAAFGKENLTRGVNVKVHKESRSLIITVNIVVGYGVNIAEVARNIREKVRYVLRHCTGIDVREVNVNVRGVKVTSIDE